MSNMDDVLEEMIEANGLRNVIKAIITICSVAVFVK